MKARRLAKLLDPFGPLNPLHPRNPLSPFKATAAPRRHPPVRLDDEHSSVLAKLYGNGALQRLPAPNMEWWWNAVSGKRFSILTNVHLFALPGGGHTAQGTVAVRDFDKKISWQETTSGTLDPGRSCRFTANGWHLHWDRRTETYSVEVHAPSLRVELAIELGPVLYFDDLPSQSHENRASWGWFDNNPTGALPYWASYRSRFSTKVAGEVNMWEPGAEAALEGAHARFDHQSLHWSPKDTGGLTLPTLGESFITRPQWFWYHLRITIINKEGRPESAPKPRPLNLLVYELRNGHSGAVLKTAAAVADDDHLVAGIAAETLCIERSGPYLGGKVPVQRTTKLSFDAAPGIEGEVYFRCRRDQGWTVRYPIARQLEYAAEEIIGDVDGEVTWQGERCTVAGDGTLEVLDMVTSIAV